MAGYLVYRHLPERQDEGERPGKEGAPPFSSIGVNIVRSARVRCSQAVITYRIGREVERELSGRHRLAADHRPIWPETVTCYS